MRDEGGRAYKLPLLKISEKEIITPTMSPVKVDSRITTKADPNLCTALHREQQWRTL